MMTSSIIKRCLNTYESPLNIVMTQCDNVQFMSFLGKVLPYPNEVLSLEDTLFGNTPPDMIICHNKIMYIDRCGHLAYFLHCPILIIDHDTKPSFIEKNPILHQSSSIYSVALNNNIYNSWNKEHNLILGFDVNNPSNIDTWRNLLYQITKISFSLKPKPIKHEQTNEQ